MVRYRRNLQPGGTYFLTVTLHDRKGTILLEYIDALRTAIKVERSRHPFGIDAIVVLPDHWHAVITLPPGDADYPGRIRRIKARFTRQLQQSGVNVPRTSTGEAVLWQRRYWEHTLRDEVDVQHHVDYIHYNPVKHGLAERPADWKYSSIHRYIASGKLPENWGGCPDVSGEGFGE